MCAEVLRFDGVSVAYNGVTVLDSFTSAVQEGEFVSLIGPNGSGKSTIINAILRVVPTTAGAIYLDGRNNEEFSAKERSRFAAVVPQSFSTSFAFTVRDIVRMGRNPYLGRFQSESAEDMNAVDDAMRQTDTYRLADRKITALSGGERQRVVISGALAQTPRLLILDEPTNHLDLNHTLEIMQLLSELNKTRKLTVFAVLHDINMASRFSDRLILINNGKIQTEGDPDSVLREEVLRPIYNIELVRRFNRLTDSIEIVPLRKRTEPIAQPRTASVHVVCGGGSGESVLQKLRENGYTTVCGVLNMSDSDAEVCHNIGVAVIAEDPYNAVSEARHRENMKAMESADVILVTDVAFGAGNVKNLEAVHRCALEGGKRVYLLYSKQETRDFTGGKATGLLEDIASCPCCRQLSDGELFELIINGEL